MRRGYWLLWCLTGVASPAAAAIEQPWKVNASVNFYSGDYGTNQVTRTTVIPVKITRFFKPADVWISLPYVSNTGDGSVTTVEGKPVPGKSGKAKKTSSVTSDKTDSGLGDIVLGAHRIFLDETGHRPEVGATAFIKLPTADEHRGLGTGQFDEGARLEFFKTFSHWFALVDTGYTWTNNSSDTHYNDRWLVSAGGGRRFTPTLTGTAMLTEERALVPGTDNPLDVVVFGDMALSRSAGIYASILLGLSDGSPDTGFSFGARWRFRRAG
jgi:hypothetical protein